MKRVLIIGSGGAGKSTLAKRLGEKLNLPVIHLDTYHWLPGWKEKPGDLWRAQVRELAAREEWVMDGDFRATLDVRLERADTVIYLDMHPMLCTYRVIKRFLKYRGRTRPDLPEGCPESFQWDFIKWVWTYRKKNRTAVTSRLNKAPGLNVYTFKTPKEVERFLHHSKNKL